MHGKFRIASRLIVVALMTLACSSGPTQPEELKLPTWMFGHWEGSTDRFDVALTLNVPSLLCYCYAAGSAYVTRSDTHSVITLRGEHTLGTQLGGAPIRILLRYPGEYGAWFVEFHGERTGENTLTGYIRVVSPKSLASEILGADSVAFAFKRQ